MIKELKHTQVHVLYKHRAAAITSHTHTQELIYAYDFMCDYTLVGMYMYTHVHTCAHTSHTTATRHQTYAETHCTGGSLIHVPTTTRHMHPYTVHMYRYMHSYNRYIAWCGV